MCFYCTHRAGKVYPEGVFFGSFSFFFWFFFFFVLVFFLFHFYFHRVFISNRPGTPEALAVSSPADQGEEEKKRPVRSCLRRGRAGPSRKFPPGENARPPQEGVEAAQNRRKKARFSTAASPCSALPKPPKNKIRRRQNCF